MLISFLPKLIKYSRAIRILQDGIDETAYMLSYSQGSQKYSPYDLAPAGLLISKLFYSEQELKLRNLNDIYRQWMEPKCHEMRTEFMKVSTFAGKHRLENSISTLGPIVEQRRRIFYALQALDTLIKRHEKVREEGSAYEHLVDQVMRPCSEYYRAVPITYSVIYTSLLNSLNIGLQAYGISYPKHFLSRLVLKSHSRNSSTANEILSSSPNNDHIRSPAKAARYRSKSFAKIFKAVETVSVYRLLGSWCCSAHNGFYEINLSYDPHTHILQARSVDKSSCGQLVLSKILWQVSFENTKQISTINLDQEYVGTVHQSSSSNMGLLETPILCSVRFAGIHPSLFGSVQHYGPAPSGNIHFEIKVTYTETNSVPEEHSVEGKKESKYDVINYYCRTSEMDWCLLDIYSEGVAPIMTMQYVDELQRYVERLCLSRRIVFN
ncbi:hypothetical protein EON65_01430 [archaeon]|nr:MAG: hypothetical protein EON65_01430 [archaeon]